MKRRKQYEWPNCAPMWVNMIILYKQTKCFELQNHVKIMNKVLLKPDIVSIGWGHFLPPNRPKPPQGLRRRKKIGKFDYDCVLTRSGTSDSRPWTHSMCLKINVLKFLALVAFLLDDLIHISNNKCHLIPLEYPSKGDTLSPTESAPSTINHHQHLQSLTWLKKNIKLQHFTTH